MTIQARALEPRDVHLQIRRFKRWFGLTLAIIASIWLISLMLSPWYRLGINGNLAQRRLEYVGAAGRQTLEAYEVRWAHQDHPLDRVGNRQQLGVGSSRNGSRILVSSMWDDDRLGRYFLLHRHH